MAGYETKSFDDLLASLPPQEKINFLAACRLIYDNIARVLRELCRSKPLPTMKKAVKLEKYDFSALVEHLLYSKRTADHECDSFFKKVSCKFIIVNKVDNTKCLKLVLDNNSSVTLKAGGKVQIPSEKDHIPLEEFEGSHYCIPFRKSLKDGASVDVYLPTEAWYCMNELRIMRNTHLGHNCAANLTDNHLKDMFKCVKGAYEKLAVHELSNAEEIYKEFEEIKTSCKDWSEEGVQIALMKYKKRVEEYWQELATLTERVGVTEIRCDDTEDKVDALKTEFDERVSALETSRHVTHGRLDALETMSRVTQETFKKTVTAGKDYVDSRVNDLQSQSDNMKKRVGHLEKTARGSGPTSVNYFSGPSHVNQSMFVLTQSTGAGHASPPQPAGAAYQTHNCPKRPQLPRPSSQFPPGAPTQDEITHLSTEIIKCPSYSLGQIVNFTKLAKALGMVECVTSIQRDSPQPYAQVSTLLTQWVEQNPENNSRDQLYKLLCDVGLSYPAIIVFDSQ